MKLKKILLIIFTALFGAFLFSGCGGTSSEDGPVEIKECRKCDGIAVGVASDEIRRYGLHNEKRSRLIKAGANIIVPDFSEFKELLKFLFES